MIFLSGLVEGQLLIFGKKFKTEYRRATLKIHFKNDRMSFRRKADLLTDTNDP